MSANGPQASWVAFLRELVQDIVTLVEVELGAARTELRTSWRQIGIVAGLSVGALVLLVWMPALIGYVLVRVAALWVPDWAAGLIVLGLFLLLTAGLSYAAYRYARRLKNPLDVILRRLQDHLDWWRRDVHLKPAESDPAPARPAEETP